MNELEIDWLVRRRCLRWLNVLEHASRHAAHHSVWRNIPGHYRTSGYDRTLTYPHSIGDNRTSAYPNVVLYNDALGSDTLLDERASRVSVNMIYCQYLY